MDIENKLKSVDQLKAEIDALGKLPKEILNKINYKFRLDWNYYSNSMEGNTLTMDETRSIMIGNITVHGKPIKDVMEMRGHDDTILQILKIGKGELNIAEKRIKDMHKAIMHEDDEERRKKIGVWKQENNYLYNYKHERIDFSPFDQVPDEIHRLIDWFNAQKEKIDKSKKGAMHPALLAFEFHIRYLMIHPFYDGNGRTARILMNLILIAFGFPPIIIKSEDKDKYYKTLADVQFYDSPKDFYYDLMLELLYRSLELVHKAATGQDIEEPEDIDKKIELLKRQLDEKDVVTKSKSPEVVYQIIRDNIFPFLQKLESKLEKLKDLFLDHSRVMQYLAEGTEYGIGSKESKWEDIYGNWLEGSINANKTLVNRITYNYALKGFKKSSSLQYIPISLKFDFQEFDFSLTINSQAVGAIDYSYDNPVNKDDLSLISTIIDPIIDQISKAGGLTNK
jgi:Fic family protein